MTNTTTTSTTTTAITRNPSPHFPPMDLEPVKAKDIRKGIFGITRFLIWCFSKNPAKQRRDPPSETKRQHLRLITIGVSHYCEKARWGLDLLENDPQSSYYYTEDAHAPPFVSFQTIPASKDEASATPMVVYEDGAYYLVKSDNVLRKHCSFLYPNDIVEQVHSIEDDLGVRVGSAIRAIVFHHLLTPPYYETVTELISRGIPKIEGKLVGILMDKGLSDGMRQFMHVNQQSHDAAVPILRHAFLEYSEMLHDDQEYLCDTPARSYGFTAADLSLAALAAPLIQPDCFFATFGVESTKLPPALVEWQTELRATRAGQHVIRMYEKHRPLVNGAVVIKSAL